MKMFSGNRSWGYRQSAQGIIAGQLRFRPGHFDEAVRLCVTAKGWRLRRRVSARVSVFTLNLTLRLTLKLTLTWLRLKPPASSF